MKRYPLFDALRIFLALEVVAAHFTALGKLPQWTPIINPVPAFLAISGFLVLQSFENSASWGRFAWKRCCRVIPAFVVSLLAIWLFLGTKYLDSTLTAWATVGLRGGGNGVVWSLMAEEIAYVLLAVLYLSGAYKAKWPIWLMLCVSLALPLAESTEIRRIGWLFVSFPIGSLFYLYRESLARLPAALWVGIFAVACLIGEESYYSQTLIGVQALAVVGVGAFVKVELPHFPDLSYSVYLGHCIVFAVLGFHWYTLPVVALVAVVSWYGWEKPALRLKNLYLGNDVPIRGAVAHKGVALKGCCDGYAGATVDCVAARS